MKSTSIKEITTALAKAQIAFLPIKRTEKVDYATTGGRKKYNYAPLVEVIEATKKALSDNGLAITQATYLQEGNIILETLLSHISGEWLSGELFVGKQDQPPQSEGSALTYKRRYGMSAILCVSSEEDDDAELAEGREEKHEPEKTPATEHFCKVHNTTFFKKGKMPGYAHKMSNTDQWCNEPKEEPEKPTEGEQPTITPSSTPDKSTPDSPEVNSATSSPESAKPSQQKALMEFTNGTELVSYAMKVKKIAWKKIQTDLGITTPEDIKDIPAAAKALFKEG